MAQTSSWLFAGLGAGPALPGVGPTLTPAGAIATVSGDQAVRQSIMLLLATLPGERVMRPDYGCPLHRIVFHPNDETTAGLAIHYVRQALLRFEPRVMILRLDAGPTPDGSPLPRDAAGTELYVRLDYRVRASGRADQIVVRVDLASEAA